MFESNCYKNDIFSIVGLSLAAQNATWRRYSTGVLDQAISSRRLVKCANGIGTNTFSLSCVHAFASVVCVRCMSAYVHLTFVDFFVLLRHKYSLLRVVLENWRLFYCT